MNKTNILSIGSGAYFPIELTESNGKTSWKAISGDIRLINQNLVSLFNTQIGELLRNENFGTRLWECLEEPTTQALNFLIRRFCKNAIESWEPRIQFVESTVSQGDYTIHITLRYRVLNNQSVENLDFSYNQTTNQFEL